MQTTPDQQEAETDGGRHHDDTAPARSKRPVRSRAAIVLLMALALVAADNALVVAQTTSGPTGGPTGNQTTPQIGEDGSNFSPDDSLSVPFTTSIVRNIDAVKAECQRYDPVYRIDCLQRGLRLTAQRIPRNAAYGDMKRAIIRAADKLDAIVRANVDTRAPRLDAKPGANPRFARNRSYRAIKRQNLAKAMAAANQVVTELQTELLRAADNSDKRQQHYQRVAVAVQSTKVLLRS
ncbi:hypothetical protein SAMN05880582_101775 [Rhizobium sp. RU20A]|uniref:hypothetical protein n=1 Tax=Rhizobium sp. RU20A TaxID=1907412 RepID=UPI000956EB63|nr:hypothetical protein [Rhizobium sp. RU20A]SIQ11117.1 hypothetical protein SAMN05880582_101775 [Rhizobium sp. RU20A]